MWRSLLTAILLSAGGTALAGLSPAGEAMLAVRGAKAVKNQKEKQAEAQAQKEKLDQLQRRYPQEVAAYQNLLKSNPEAAQRQLAQLVDRYQKDTGVDLDKKYAVKPSGGIVKRLRNQAAGESAVPATGQKTDEPKAAEAQPRRGLLRGWLRDGVNDVRDEINP